MTRKIRVLYTIPNFDTAGSGKLLLSLMNRMDRSGFDLQICCLHTRGTFFESVQKSGFPVHVHSFVADMSNRLSGMSKVLSISRFFRSLKVDIVHSFHYSSEYSEALAARLAGCKWIYTKKNMSWHGKSKNGWRLRSWLANGIIAQNSDMMEMFFANQRKAVMIPSAVDIDAFAPGIPDTTVRERLGTPPDRRIVITVANLVPVKGVEILIEAFSLVADRHSEWMLWIVGDCDNDYGKFLKELCGSRGIGARTKFVGRQADVRPFLDQAEIYVIPTLNEGRREGSPVALLEAMANEKVVLASAVSGITDQLSPYPESLFHPGDVDELAKKLSLWMSEDRNILSERGREFASHVTKNYSTTVIAAKHEAFYRQILGKA